MTQTSNRWIRVDVSAQTLTLFDGAHEVKQWQVSTALNGVGERRDTGCTPRGMHHVRIKIGAGCPINTVLVGRRPSGEIYDVELAEVQPERDWILTRILWLTGRQSGINRGGDCDTLRRYIYIHGCPDSEPMGIPLSHGCIRMWNQDVVELFDLVEVGTRVEIVEGTSAI